MIVTKAADRTASLVKSTTTFQIGMNGHPKGGLDRYFHGLLPSLSDQGHGVRGVVFGASSLSGVRALEGRFPSMIGRWAALREEVARTGTQCDALVSHFAPHALPILDFFRDKPLIVHFHGPWAQESAFEGASFWNVMIKRFIEKAVYGRGTKFIALSKAFARILEHDYAVDPDMIRVIPGGVDTSRFSDRRSRANVRALLGLPQGRPIILTVRRLVRAKGVDTLIRAVAELRRRLDDVYLVIAGTGSYATDLQRLSRELNLENHVRFLGYVDESLLPCVYRAADITIVPSIALEGFGLIVLEALATGTPVLVTPVAGLEEAVAPLDPSLVFEGIQSRQIAEHVERALLGQIALPSSETCVAYAKQFDWSQIAARVADVYGHAV